jgi:hypothetical protein
MKLSHDFRSHTSEIWIFEVIFVDFRLTNIFLTRLKVSCNHARQIFGSKRNWNYVSSIWFFLRDNHGKKRNLNVCSAHSYTHGPSQFDPLLPTKITSKIQISEVCDLKSCDSFINMLFISTGIFDKLRPQILSVGTTANSPLRPSLMSRVWRYLSNPNHLQALSYGTISSTNS